MFVNDWQTLLELDDSCIEEEDLALAVSQMLLLFADKKRQQNIKWHNEHLNWDEHVKREPHTCTFDVKWHMPVAKFDKLVRILANNIMFDFAKSSNSMSGNDPICPELIVGMGLQCLGGKLVKSLEDIFGVDHSSVPRLLDVFLWPLLHIWRWQ